MIKILPTFFILIILLFNTTTSAQTEKCAFDKIIDSKRQDPVFQKNRTAYEKFVKQFADSAPTRSPGATVIIPCVVHIIHTGQAIGIATSTGANPNDAQVNSAISDMTDAFRHQGVYSLPAKNGFYDAATDVEFILAQRAPDGSATTGIIRHDVSGESWGTDFANNGMDAGETPGVPQETIAQGRYWPPSDYMNIWIVHEIENDMTTLGFASFPATNDGSTDGLTMLASAFGYDPTNTAGYLLDPGTNLNGTANHEIGHYLSLYHSFTGMMVERYALLILFVELIVIVVQMSLHTNKLLAVLLMLIIMSAPAMALILIFITSWIMPMMPAFTVFQKTKKYVWKQH